MVSKSFEFYNVDERNGNPVTLEINLRTAPLDYRVVFDSAFSERDRTFADKGIVRKEVNGEICSYKFNYLEFIEAFLANYSLRQTVGFLNRHIDEEHIPSTRFVHRISHIKDNVKLVRAHKVAYVTRRGLIMSPVNFSLDELQGMFQGSRLESKIYRMSAYSNYNPFHKTALRFNEPNRNKRVYRPTRDLLSAKCDVAMIVATYFNPSRLTEKCIEEEINYRIEKDKD